MTPDQKLIDRCRALILKRPVADRAFFQERLDRYLVAVSNTEGPDGKSWEMTARDRALNLERYLNEERRGR